MKKLICLLLLGVTLTASAQKHTHTEKGKTCAKCENPYKRYTQDLPFQMPDVQRPSSLTGRSI